MRANLITVGPLPEQTERFLSREFSVCSFTIEHRLTADNARASLRKALGDALREEDCVLIVGGTEDGAAATVAATLALTLAPYEAGARRQEEHADATGHELTEAERRLTHLPKGATPFENAHGALPGFAVEKYGQTVLALPSAFEELAPMFQQSVIPYLSKFDSGALVSRTVGVFGLSEAAVTQRISDLMADSNPTVSLFSREGGEILLRLTARAADEESAEALCRPVIDDIRERLGAFVYGEDVGSLQMAVIRLLSEKQMKVATAESCTAGLLSSKLTQVSGASAVFECGIAAYSREIKHDVLGVPEEVMDRGGTVCADTACGMATGARRVGNSDIAVGITGEAGPNPSEDKPVGTVFIALADSRRVWVKELHAGAADRNTIREIATCQALDLIRRYLEALPAVMAGGQLLEEPVAADPVIPKAAPTKKRRILSSIFPWKGDTPKAIISKTLLWLGILAVLTAAWVILSVYVFAPARNRSQYTSLENLYTDSAAVSGYDPADFPAGMLSRFYALYEKNEDIKGWIRIADTAISYPIVQNSARDYSAQNFSGAPSEYGVPYFDDNVALASPASVNRSYIVHGNNTSDGQMFSELLSYTDASFLLRHSLVEMNTIYATGSYEVFGVFYIDENETEPDFSYRTVAFDGNEEFRSFVNAIQERSLFRTSVPVRPDDTLLLLETDASGLTKVEGIRLIVAARLLPFGEGVSKDLEISYNPTAKLPAALISAEPVTTVTAEAVTTTAHQSSDDLPDIDWPDPETTDGSEVPTEATGGESTASGDPEATRSPTDDGASTEATDLPPTETAPSESEPTATETGDEAPTTTEEAPTTTGEDPTATEEKPATTTAEEPRPTGAGPVEGTIPESAFYSTLTVKIGNNAPAAVRTPEELQYAVACVVKTELGSARMMANSTEAQKAQAVAGYTYMLYTCRSGGTFAISSSIDLKNATDKKIYDAVGQVLGVKMGDVTKTSVAAIPLCAMYSSSCNGATASCQNVYTAALPYLQSVSSPYDTDAMVNTYSAGGDTLTSTYSISFSELKQKMDAFVSSETGGAVTEVSLEEGGDTPLFAKTYDTMGGYVVDTNAYYVYKGKTVYLRGIDIRKIIGSGSLRSHSFTLSYNDSTDLLTFTVKGHGHGLGLSQYGAVGYANEAGWDYRQILTHYYSLSDTGPYRLIDPVWD